MPQTSPFAKALTKHAHAPKSKTRAKITVTNIAPPKWESKYESVLLIIKNGTVFIPSKGGVPDRFTLYVEPIYQCSLNFQDVLSTVDRVMNQKKTILTNTEGERLLHATTKRDDPILKATNSTSRRNLEKTAAFYAIDTIEHDTKWLLYLNDPQRKGAKTLEFPISTPLDELVRLILADVKQYPHVLRDTQTPPTP